VGAGVLCLIRGLWVSQEITEQIPQDSILAGNNIIKSLILEYAIIRQNGIRKI
jgi:hypothetical protein